MSGSRSTQGNNTRSWYPKWCTVKAEIFSGVLFSVTSVPTIFTEKMHRTFSVLLSGTSTLTWKAGITENFPPPNRRFWRIPKILHHRKFLLLQYTDWIHGDSTWSVVYATRDCGLDPLAPSMGQSSDAICEHVCIALAPKAVRATVTGSPGLNPHYWFLKFSRVTRKASCTGWSLSIHVYHSANSA